MNNLKYFPIISNDTITLYTSFNFFYDDYAYFDIVLNDLQKKIGTIDFHFNKKGFSYSGNVGYLIYDDFQGNHYATQALSLLKELLIEKKVKKDLYVSTLPNNIKSQKVALNNGGKLVYEGEVPSCDAINMIDGIKEVKVYKIPIKNKRA